jgi:hypothetical protein
MGERNQVFYRLSQANRCFLNILEHQNCLKAKNLVSDFHYWVMNKATGGGQILQDAGKSK